MENQEKLNPQTEQSNNLRKETQQPSVETARSKELAEKALWEAKQARSDVEQYGVEMQGHRRSSRALWGAVAILAIALGAVSWYGYRTAEEHTRQFAKFPAIEESLQAVGQRFNAAEDKFQAWASDWKGVGDRLGKLEKRVTSDFQLAKNYAKEQANEVHRQMVAELDNRTEWLQARLGRIESNEESQRAHLARLQEEIAQTRQEMNQQIAEQIAEVRRETGRDLDNLYQRSAGTRSDLDAMARKLDRRRVDFELAKDANRELVPGISMTLQKTDVSYQRVEGWVQLIPEGRFLWVRGQGIQQPLTFYKQEDSRPYELVFTRITKDGAIGYLVTPGGQPVDSSASGSSRGEAELASSSVPTR